jgi:hypothetical protein
MKFSAQRTQLQRVAAKAVETSARVTSTPLLKYIKIHAKDAVVWFSGASDGQTVVYEGGTTHIEVSVTGSCVVPARIIGPILAKIPKEDETLEFELDGNTLCIKFGHDTHHIVTVPEWVTPVHASGDATECDGDALAGALARSWAADAEPANRVLHSVSLGDDHVVAGTRGESVRTLGEPVLRGIALPRPAADAVRGFAAKHETCRSTVDTNRLTLRSGFEVLTVSRAQDKYPPIASMYVVTGEPVATLPGPALTNAIKRLNPSGTLTLKFEPRVDGDTGRPAGVELRTHNDGIESIEYFDLDEGDGVRIPTAQDIGIAASESLAKFCAAPGDVVAYLESKCVVWKRDGAEMLSMRTA